MALEVQSGWKSEKLQVIWILVVVDGEGVPLGAPLPRLRQRHKANRAFCGMEDTAKPRSSSTLRSRNRRNILSALEQPKKLQSKMVAP